MARNKPSKGSSRVPRQSWPHPSPPPPLRDVLSQIGAFLATQGYSNALAALEKDAKSNNVEIDIERWQALNEAGLMEMWVGARDAKKGLPSLDAEDSATVGKKEVEDGSKDSSSDSDSSAQAGKKRKRVMTPSSSSGSDSSSSDSDSASEKSSSSGSSSSDSSSDSSSEDERPAKKRAKVTEKKAKKAKKSSSSGSDSSSDSSSDSDSDSSSVSKKSKSSSSDSSSDSDSSSASSESESGSSSSSSSSSDSESSSGSSKKAKKAKKDKKVKKEKKGKTEGKAKKEKKKPTTTSNGQSDSSATLGAEDATEAKPNDTLVIPAADDSNVPPQRVPATKENLKQLKKENVPFSRIPADTRVDPRFASNEYVPYDYADRAFKDLSVTKGKGFTKEKNKKKRGAYRGGAIDLTPKGIKFED